jgi:hypothetical protein
MYCYKTFYDEIKAKSNLILCSQYDGKSIFYDLPKELKEKIICDHCRLFQRSVFKSPEQTTHELGEKNELPFLCNVF